MPSLDRARRVWGVWGLGKTWWSPLPCRPTLLLGYILRKNYTKNKQRRGTMKLEKQIHISRFWAHKKEDNLSAKWQFCIKEVDVVTGGILTMQSTHVSDLWSCHTKVRQQLVGEKAGAAKCDEITWTEKRSIKATPENTWTSTPKIDIATSPQEQKNWSGLLPLNSLGAPFPFSVVGW